MWSKHFYTHIIGEVKVLAQSHPARKICESHRKGLIWGSERFTNRFTLSLRSGGWAVTRANEGTWITAENRRDCTGLFRQERSKRLCLGGWLQWLSEWERISHTASPEKNQHSLQKCNFFSLEKSQICFLICNFITVVRISQSAFAATKWLDGPRLGGGEKLGNSVSSSESSVGLKGTSRGRRGGGSWKEKTRLPGPIGRMWQRPPERAKGGFLGREGSNCRRPCAVSLPEACRAECEWRAALSPTSGRKYKSGAPGWGCCSCSADLHN